LDDSTIAFANNPGSITAYDLIAKKNVWTFGTGGKASLTGIAPQLRRDGEYLDVLFSRNHGCELVRLNARGQAVWKSGPVFLDAASVRLDDMAADREHLFVSQPDRVIAIRADTGRTSWQTPLPSNSQWSLHSLGNAIAVVPRTMEMPRFEKLPTALLWHNPFQIAAAFAEPEPVPILLLSPETGEIKHRLEIPSGPIIAATVRSSGLWLAAPRAIYLVK
jgi:hypothetical protein